MNFFQHQDQARRASRRMLVLFGLSVVAVVAAIDLVVAFAFYYNSRKHGVAMSPGVMYGTSLITLAVIGLASLYKVSTLRAGGAVVARELGGTPVLPETTNFAWRRLRNVVEEIAIASGVPVPEIYVLEQEEGINAFASGYTPADAAVTVTAGALKKLTRDELQGVIAHEFSHILNGDMRLNIRLMGVVFGLLVLAVVGKKILETTSGRDRNSGPIVAFGLGLVVIGGLGMLCGRLIKARLSRQREFLADASAVQFTRQTLGISGALKKVGSLTEGSKLATAGAEEVSHMLFGDGVGYSALFATHPKLVDRIRRMEPRFDEREFIDIARKWNSPVRGGDTESSDASIGGYGPAGESKPKEKPQPKDPLPQALRSALPIPQASLILSAVGVAGQVGNPASDDYRTAGAINLALPDALREQAYDAQRAIPLVLSLALAQDAPTRERQLAMIGKAWDEATQALCGQIVTATDQLHPLQRLPLAALAFPALRHKPRPELQRFLISLNQLIQADGQVSLDEYCLAKLITLQVMDALDPSKVRVSGSRKLPQCSKEIAQVFALVARYGHDDLKAAERAYVQGMREVLPEANLPFAPPDEGTLALDRALPLLDQLQPAGKELVVRGLTRAVSDDGQVSVAEAELLRIVCAALHCPLPPMLQQAA